MPSLNFDVIHEIPNTNATVHIIIIESYGAISLLSEC